MVVVYWAYSLGGMETFHKYERLMLTRNTSLLPCSPGLGLSHTIRNKWARLVVTALKGMQFGCNGREQQGGQGR